MGTVSQCVIWLIRCRPYSPSWLSVLRLGITGTRICMTMDAVIYGYTPRAATLMRERAPPLNRSKKPSSACCSNAWLSAWMSTPGTGTWATNRKTVSMARVNSIFARRSGTRIASIIDWMSCGLDTSGDDACA